MPVCTALWYIISHCVLQPSIAHLQAYWTISGRIWHLKTSGSGCEALLGLPSGEMIVTVGREVIVPVMVQMTSMWTSNSCGLVEISRELKLCREIRVMWWA
ncbi:hypothetical protein P152DRAFT_109530 [Eremomyces bilateralis CBS 781.70]|uniref:Secreted protein n=1 Tax=Eremomyces bilateralis CBS 781.70 TaxID=1392243 RepID=A0A6G1GD79_9PEZI|nr:uncharacterized protein P152DRAFT_109530 [Eremomyces bilateralis CBS 781.70]KAF1816055.1 hypothetical protein P152DRAFT_109530 [Eremomyces bilateralis CBS 781.70]